MYNVDDIAGQVDILDKQLALLVLRVKTKVKRQKAKQLKVES